MKNTKFLILTVATTFLGVGIILGQVITEKAINLPQIKQEYVSIIGSLYFAKCVESLVHKNTCFNQAEKIAKTMKEEITKDPYSTSLPIPQLNKPVQSAEISQEDLINLYNEPMLKI